MLDTSSGTPVLSVENIETYYGPIQAVRGISLEVREGSLVTLLGANGAGKSSTLKTISGILEPDKGRVTLKELRSRGNGQTVSPPRGCPCARRTRGLPVFVCSRKPVDGGILAQRS